MSFWSGLGKILGPVAGIAAAPFTGGASLIPTLLQAGGAAVSGMAGASAANRGETDRTNLTRDQLRLQDASNFERALMDRQRLDLDRRNEGRTESKDAYNMALRSALAKNMQDVSFDRSGFKTPVANISFAGGARPSALGAEGRDAAAVMNNQALQRLMNPQAFQEVSAPERTQISEPQKASIWEKIAGPLGLGLSVAGQVADRNRPIQTTPIQQVARDPRTLMANLPDELTF